MRLAALVSGGKDSCHALGLAAAGGHAVVCMLNLAPADAGAHDADSHCFQTVGHAALDALAEATGLPLLRRRMTGASLDTGMLYDGGSGGAGDEVEDLAALVAAAAAAFPGLGGVVSGAVASDYQRLRVENVRDGEGGREGVWLALCLATPTPTLSRVQVCARLGLVSIAPLWRTPQPRLLADMLEAGLDAIVVKVASGGLGAAELGASLASVTPRLLRLAHKLGVHPAGEGGEYETLTLDCAAFGRARLEVADAGRAVDGGGGALALAGTRLAVVLKPGGDAIPPGAVTWVPDAAAAPPPLGPAAGGAPGGIVTAVRASASGWQVSATAPAGDGSNEAIGAAVGAALQAAAGTLAAARAPPLAAAAHVRLALPSMAAFEASNGAYARCLRPVNPPARACVACPLPAGVGAVVDAFVPASPRAALHVQSVSPWAPACIGPYAQATVAGGVARLAGVIGLEPWSMTLVDRGEAARARASADAVGVAVGADLRRAALLVTCFASEAAGVEGLAAAGQTGGPADDPDPDAYIDPYLRRPPSPFAAPLTPLRVFLLARGLPRGAAVELEPVAATAAAPRGFRSAHRLANQHAIAAPGCLCVALAAAGDLKEGLAAAAESVAAALRAAELPPEAVAIARAHVRADAGTEAAVGAAVAAAWARAGLAAPPPALSWAAAVGVTPVADAVVVLEVQAFGEVGGGSEGSD